MSLVVDRRFGAKSEDEQRDVLEMHFGESLQKDTYKWAVFDFFNKDKTINVEMKSRNNKHDTYATTIVGYNKIRACSDPMKRYYFAFVFTDGIYYIQYDKTLFDTFDCNDFVRNGRVDYNDKIAKYVFIPINALTRM